MTTLEKLITSPIARRATVDLLYNSSDATAEISSSLSSFQYVDVASGSSDSINIKLSDVSRKWINGWFPEKGDTLQPTIRTINWDGAGQIQALPCGKFYVDDIGFSGGPLSLSLKALATQTESDFRKTARDPTHEKTTLQEIAQKIADTAGMTLVYDGDTVNIEKVEQDNQTDCDFITKLADKYGFVIKIYDDKLVVFQEAKYEEKDAKVILTEADFEPDWTWDTKLVGTYTGAKFQYADTLKNKTYTVTVGEGPRILTVGNTEVGDLSEATVVALAALNKANKGTTTMSLKLKAIVGLVATDCVQIAGLGQLSGKYYVDKVTHDIGSGYKMSLELSKVEERFTEATTLSSSIAEESS